MSQISKAPTYVYNAIFPLKNGYKDERRKDDLQLNGINYHHFDLNGHYRDSRS